MTSTADDILEKFKRHPFAKGLLPFRSTVKSLDSPVPAICAIQDGRQRWVISDKGTRKPAIFSYAAVFAYSDHQATGNYVPTGEVTPYGVDPKGVQARANLKCFYSYVFDTHTDISLYEGQWSLDEYMSTVPGFNVGGLPRRSYLSGQDEKFRARFWMQTPIFLRRSPNDAHSAPAPEYLHAWIKHVDRDSKVFKANPDRPRIWVKEGDEILPIAERPPGTLQKGDVVAMSFTVTYHLTSVNWFAQFHPADIIVLKSWDGDATDYSAPVLDLYSRPPPTFDVFKDDIKAVEGILASTSVAIAPAVDAAVADGSSHSGSTSGTLDGDASDACDANTAGAGKGKGVDMGTTNRVVEQNDPAEGFEVLGPQGHEELEAPAGAVEGGGQDEERRSTKPGSAKNGRAGRKARG